MQNFIFNPPNKPEGLYHIPDMPDQKNFEYFEPNFGKMTVNERLYNEALSLAISQSIPVEDEERVMKTIFLVNRMGILVEDQTREWEGKKLFTPGEIYRIDCKVEKKMECDTCGCQRQCENPAYYAVVSPIEKKESCRKCNRFDCSCDAATKHYLKEEQCACIDPDYLGDCPHRSNKEQPKQEDKPNLIEKFTDNGEHSHYELIDNNGKILWPIPQESSEEEQDQIVSEFFNWITSEEVEELTDERVIEQVKSKFTITRKTK